MSTFSIFFIFLLLTSSLAIEIKRKRQTDADCKDAVSVPGCSDDLTQVLTLFRTSTYFMTATFRTECSFDKINYKWGVYDEDEEVLGYENGNVFIIKPFVLRGGFYSISVAATVTRDEGKSDAFFACALQMEALDPIAIIHGGTERTVESNQEFIVDGSKSIDRDVPLNETGKLIYNWTCRVIQGERRDFCEKEYTGTLLRVPSNYAINDYTYVFTLSVKNEESDKWISTEQTVTVLRDVTELEIVCEKNCPPAAPATDRRRLTFLRVRCLKKCQNVVESSYEWSVNQSDFNYEESTQFGRNTDKFIIREDVLEYGMSYNVQVKLRVGEGTAGRVLKVPLPIKIESCNVTPTQGEAVETRFSVKCKYNGIGRIFEIFTTKNEKNVVVTKGYSLNNLEFMLPSDTEVYVKIVDVNGFQDNYKLDVEVKPLTKEIDSLVSSIKTSISKGNTDSAIQRINGIIEHIAQKPISETQPIKQIILETLSTLPIDSQDSARQIALITSRLVHDPSMESNPYQALPATEICSRAADVLLTHLKNEYHTKTLTNHVQENAKTVLSCAETDTKENFKILQPELPDFTITTPFPVLRLPVIEENYPDYETDHTVPDKKKKYELASKNFVKICETNLEMLVETVVEGEEMVVAESNSCSAQVVTATGKTLSEMKIESKGGMFYSSSDLEDVEDSVDFMVCTWNNNPFWWKVFDKHVSTNVFLIKMLRFGEEMKNFIKPNRFELSLVSQVEVEILQVEISNRNPARIDVKKNESFFVKFRKLSPSDSYRVSVTNFEKPEILEDVKIVTKTDNVLYQEEVNGFDSWYYIYVLDSESIKLSLSVYTMSCYSWSTENKEWSFACKGTEHSNEEKIVCDCHHLSIIAGISYNNPIKVDKITTEPNFEMVLLNSFVIFITISTTFAIYCFSLIFTKERKLKKNIFLLGDIFPFSRYVYLLIIRTGRKPSSGTSSNICIKLFGDQSRSRSHILNYPDPQQKILQRSNTDWFILPTHKRLGNLQEISLWSDCSGRRPRWRCKDVIIYDFQYHNRWYFDVNSWLDLPPNGKISVNVKISDEKKESWFGKLIFRLWPKLYQDFPYFKKMTFVLSILMMIYLSCFVMYGVPSLTLKDGFAKVEKYQLSIGILFVTLISSIVTFVFHTILMWLFRNSGTDKKISLRIRKYVWILLTSNIVVSFSILLIFGFWMPSLTGYSWLTSVAIATLVYFFILENIFETVLNFFADKTPILKENLQKLVPLIEDLRKYLFRKFGPNLLRLYFTHLYRPMNEDDIKERKAKVDSRKRFFELLEDTVMFVCYVTLLYLAIFANKNLMTVLNYKEMLSLLSGHHTRTHSYTKIHSIDSFYDYINNTLIPTLHAQQWYSTYVVLESGLMSDFHNKFLGVARLRQRRVTRTDCQVPFMVLPNQTCRSEFWDSEETYNHFGPEHNDFVRLSQVWNFTSSKFAGISVYIGKFGIYRGGGYIAPLGRTWFNSYANLLYLRNNSWLDDGTSVIMVEFLAYNVNTNLFNAVQIVIEKSTSGYFRTKVVLNTAQFLFVKNEEGFAQVVIFAFFVLIVFIFTVKFLFRICRGKLLVLSDLWTFVDLVIVALSYTCFVLFVHRARSVKTFLDRIEQSKKNEFVDYFGLLYEETTFTLVAAFLIFVATIRLWKVCRIGTVFKIMEKTIILSSFPIALIFFFHMIVMISFTLCGYLLFSSTSRSFKDVSDTLVTLMLLTIGFQNDFDLVTITNSNPTLSKMYYSAFMLLNLLFLTVYICVIMISYYRAQVASNEDFAGVLKFLSAELKFYRTSLKMTMARIRGGTVEKKHFVTPKSDDLRYANCITLKSNLLELMCCITLRNLNKKMSEDDKFELMRRVVRCSKDGDAVDVFYRGKRGDNLIKILHDDAIKKIARAAEVILCYDEKKREKNKRKYKRMLERQLIKLDFVCEMLKAILNVVSNINVE